MRPTLTPVIVNYDVPMSCQTGPSENYDLPQQYRDNTMKKTLFHEYIDL